MAEPFLAEIRLMSFDFPPKGWAFCNGQLMPINQNQALFSLLGTQFGGDGRVNFALPDLRGRLPLSYFDSSFTIGTRGGEVAHTLTMQEMPQHLHFVNANPAAQGGGSNPTNRVLGGANNAYHSPGALQPINPATVGNSGGSQPHDNMAPYLVLNFCIALQGIFPSPN